MERQDIEVFLVLAEELHFARTAERLHVSAATISQTIAKLERRFGAPLFRRTTRRAELSSLGRQLLDDLQPAHAQVQAAIARATAAGHGITGTLELGYMSAAVAQIVLPLADTFRDRVPGRRVAIRETTLAPGLVCIPMGGDATFDYALVWRTDRLRTIAEAFLRHIAPLTGC